MERWGEGWGDMTFMISGTIWSKEVQRQKEVSEMVPALFHLALKCVCAHVSVTEESQ